MLLAVQLPLIIDALNLKIAILIKTDGDHKTSHFKTPMKSHFVTLTYP